MNVKRSKAEWLRRYASFVVILFVIAFGTSLSIRANLGSSPISAPPYILSLIPGMRFTMGQLTIFMHVFFILTQIVLLRKDFEKRQYTQILVSFLFGFYTDLTMWMTGFLQIPETLNPLIGYPLRFVELLTGGAILAYGIACEVRCDSLMLAGEGFPLAISKFLKRDFGKVKMCTDTSLVCVGTAFMLVFFGGWDWKMVGAGTLVSMFYVGYMVRVFTPRIAWLDNIFIPKAERHAAEKAAAGDAWNGNRVVTIARTYGSGGNAIGEEVARRLGCPCYNRQLIDRTAAQMGYSPEFVEKMLKMQDMTKEDLLENWRKDTEEMIRAQIILDKIMKKEDFPVDEEELNKRCEETLKNIPEADRESYKGMIKDEMQFAKVVPFLLEKNTFKEGKKLSYQEFLYGAAEAEDENSKEEA